MNTFQPTDPHMNPNLAAASLSFATQLSDQLNGFNSAPSEPETEDNMETATESESQMEQPDAEMEQTIEKKVEEKVAVAVKQEMDNFRRELKEMLNE